MKKILSSKSGQHAIASVVIWLALTAEIYLRTNVIPSLGELIFSFPISFLLAYTYFWAFEPLLASKDIETRGKQDSATKREEHHG